MRAILYYGFFKIDFLHSRVVIAALLPFAAVVALLLSGLTSNTDDSKSIAVSHRWRIWLWSLCALLGVAAIHYGLRGWEANLDIPDRRLAFRHLNLSRAVFLRTLALSALVVAAIAVLRLQRTKAPLRALISASIGAAIALECFFYASERLLGEHTRTYPMAFRGGNYFSAPVGVMNPPARECRVRLQHLLENDHYRTVVVANSIQFQPFVAPHLAQFWQLRLLDGYPGLPLRLAELPWPTAVANLRSIAFRSVEDIPWRLLSVLNVRNAIVLTEALYYNVPGRSGTDASCPALSDITVLQNPFPVLPRHFFVADVRPGRKLEPLRPVEQFSARSLAPDVVELSWWAQIRDGDVEIQLRRFGEVEFATVGRFSPLRQTHHVLSGLKPGSRYEFRVRKLDARGGIQFVSEPIVASPSDEHVSLPEKRQSYDQLVRKAFPFDPMKTAIVEGIDAPHSYAARGAVRASYAGDRARFDFDAASEPRFLIVNELFHPRWHAYIDGSERRIEVVNRVMRGIEIPSGVRTLELRFEPFSASRAAIAFVLLGLIFFVAFLVWGSKLNFTRRASQ
jgi:hypothetical protein